MNETEQKILEQIRKGVSKPSFLSKKISISRQALHRHLKELIQQKQIRKEGSGPHVTYQLTSFEVESRIQESVEFFENLLPQYLKKYSKKIEGSYKLFKNTNKKNHPDFIFMLDSAALYSSKIEGNSLNLNSFLNSRMLLKKHRPKEAQEIEDLIEAYQFSQKNPLNEKNMLKAHGMLSRDFVTKTRQGKYRQESVGVFSSGGMEYLAIEAKLAPLEMQAFFESVEALRKKKMVLFEVFFWASWIHLTMALIHPFIDGNGRIARLCEKWFLKEHLGKEAYFLPSEEHYFKNRPAYYQSLKLGVNYWETDFGKSMDFLRMLGQSLSESDT